jgi:metacaspase-1
LVLNLNIYKSDQIRLLTDDKATRKAILAGLQWLVDGSHAGDKVLFYFSGHGAQQPDTNGDEDDRLDETLCPVDASATRANMVVDDEINDYLQKLAGRKVLVVIDSCHSGTITKSVLPKGFKFKTPIFTTPLPAPRTKGVTTEHLITPAKGGIVVYTAVASNQVAVATENGSVFTNAFVNAIKQSNGKISNKEILAAITKESEKACQRQQSACSLGLTPQMEVGSASLENNSSYAVEDIEV